MAETPAGKDLDRRGTMPEQRITPYTPAKKAKRLCNLNPN